MNAIRHYGGPVDMLRQLGELDVSVVLSRETGVFRLGYNVPIGQVAFAKIVLDAFGAGEDWEAYCIIAASALAGAEPLKVPIGAKLKIDLKAAFAEASAELTSAGLLERGLLQ